ncbi:MAG TPA: 30S ribosomal protein S20 [Myxococcota bacterium]|nr:30S ribosomal protein S20 [Myxococcota bacterium]HRY93829.1 30S ribosomal protein S20 [Myxococcota bacterium]HSA22180.1 30S ribosomal protein S20 [Myxococcota bacterium]
MATHASAEKRHRQSLKRRTHNRSARAKVQTEVRKLTEVLEGKDTKKTEEQLRKAISSLMKAATKGVMRKRTAARKVGRLSAAVHRKQKA